MNISQEALKVFGLSRHPFQGDCENSDKIYYSADHYYVKDALAQAARVMGCLTAIIGEVGSGKTTVKNDFIEQAESQGVIVIQPAMLDKTFLNVPHLEEALQEGLEEGSALSSNHLSREARSRKLARSLQKSRKAGGRHVLLIEEAQDLKVPVLKVLKRLVEIKAGNQSCISVVMIGQPELQNRLNSVRNYHLRELIHRTVVAQLAPLGSAAELRDYLALKFEKPGEILGFDAYEAMLDVLSEAKSGRRESAAYPLAINNLVAAALNQAAELGLDTVNAEVIRSA